MGRSRVYYGAASPEKEMFRGLTTTDQKLERLAEAFFDAYAWRAEESGLLADLSRRVKRLEEGR
jgi:hypothetical protein